MRLLAVAVPALAALATGAAVAVPAVSATTADAALPATCDSGRLAARVLSEQGATGHIQVVVGLRNTATRPCSVTGYPDAQLLAADGRPLPTTVEHGGSPAAPAATPRQVTLRPGGTASFALAYSHIPGSTGTACPTADRVAIIPPGAHGQVVLTTPMDPCGGVLHATPVTAPTR